MKYINSKKLIAEINRRWKSNLDAEKKFAKIQTVSAIYGAAAKEAYDILAIVEKYQQEQPNVDLEKEIDACWQNWLSTSNQKEVEGVLPKTEFAFYARHFYELGLNAKKK